MKIMNEGEEDFVSTYRKAYMEFDKENQYLNSDDQRVEREPNYLCFSEIIKEIIEFYNITEEHLKFSRRFAADARRLLVYICIRNKIISRKALREYLNISESRLSNILYESINNANIREQAIVIRSRNNDSLTPNLKGE